MMTYKGNLYYMGSSGWLVDWMGGMTPEKFQAHYSGMTETQLDGYFGAKLTVAESHQKNLEENAEYFNNVFVAGFITAWAAKYYQGVTQQAPGSGVLQPKQCFVAGTLIPTPSGTKFIEDVIVGD